MPWVGMQNSNDLSMSEEGAAQENCEIVMNINDDFPTQWYRKRWLNGWGANERYDFFQVPALRAALCGQDRGALQPAFRDCRMR